MSSHLLLDASCYNHLANAAELAGVKTMAAHHAFSNVRLFAVYAGDDIDRWRELIGRRVVHRHRGQGIVIGVVPGQDNTPILQIRYDQDDGDDTYWKHHFSDTWFCDVSLPTNHVGISQAAQVLAA